MRKHRPLTMDSLISSNSRASSVFSWGQNMLQKRKPTFKCGSFKMIQNTQPQPWVKLNAKKYLDCFLSQIPKKYCIIWTFELICLFPCWRAAVDIRVNRGTDAGYCQRTLSKQHKPFPDPAVWVWMLSVALSCPHLAAHLLTGIVV